MWIRAGRRAWSTWAASRQRGAWRSPRAGCECRARRSVWSATTLRPRVRGWAWRDWPASRRAGGLIPLCRPLPLELVEVDAALDESLPGVRVSATVSVEGKTGVEMEALTAVAVACLTVYDMVKSADRAMTIEAIRLVHKSGGRSGEYHAPPRAD